MNKAPSTIGLCRRAGKLVIGFDAVVQELDSPKTKAAGLVLAADISPKTEKEIRFAAEKHGKEVLKAEFTMDEANDAIGKRVGDSVEFGGLLGSAPVMPVHPESAADFIARGGRIPAPLHSLKN